MIAVLRSLTLRQRFAVLAAAGVGLVAAPLWQAFEVQRTELAASRAAVASIAPLNSAVELLRQLQVQRGLSSTAVGAEPASEAEQKKQEDDTRARLQKLREQLETLALGDSTQHALALGTRVEALAAAPPRGRSATRPSEAQRTALVEDQLHLLAGLADEAGLSRVPNAADRDLVSAAADGLPRAIETLAQMRTAGDALLSSTTRDAAERARLDALASDAREQLQRTLQRMRRAAQAQPEIATVIAETLDAGRQKAERAIQLARSDIAARETPAIDAALWNVAVTSAIDAQHLLLDRTSAALQTQLASHVDEQRRAMATFLAGVVALGLFAAGIGVACMRSIRDPLLQAVAAARSAAQGRLDHRIDTGGHDETGELLAALGQLQSALRQRRLDDERRLGEAESQQRIAARVSDEIGSIVEAATQGDFTRRLPLDGRHVFHAQLCGRINQLIDTVGDSLKRIGDAAEPLGEVAIQVSHTSHGLSSAVSQQAACARQTASTLAQISASARLTAGHAASAGSIAGQAALEAREAAHAATKTSTALQTIVARTTDIDDLAYRLQLLAVNAVIEASRADAESLGFGAVAAEMRQLAERTQAAAQDLAAVAGAPSGQAERATELLLSIGSGVEKARELARQIATASDAQAEAVARIDETTRNLSSASQRHAQVVGQLSATAGRLQTQASQLQAALAWFRLASSAPTPQAPGAPRPPAPAVKQRSIPATTDVDERAFTPF